VGRSDRLFQGKLFAFFFFFGFFLLFFAFPFLTVFFLACFRHLILSRTSLFSSAELVAFFSLFDSYFSPGFSYLGLVDIFLLLKSNQQTNNDKKKQKRSKKKQKKTTNNQTNKQKVSTNPTGGEPARPDSVRKGASRIRHDAGELGASVRL
jgi:hypothetical protein